MPGDIEKAVFTTAVVLRNSCKPGTKPNYVVTNGNVNKNTGGVLFLNNVFITLSCTDNFPVPSGSGNTVTTPDGQCASGFP